MLEFNMEHVDEFASGDFVCWLTASNVPDDFIADAKKIDHEFFLKDCFCVCVNSENYNFSICQDKLGYELCYIDNEGDKHWMNYLLRPEESNEAIKLCKEYLGIQF